jgi:glucose-1-phosphate thymidylyltransferase
MDGWRADVGYPEDRETAEQRLEGTEPTAEDVDEDTADAEASAE